MRQNSANDESVRHTLNRRPKSVKLSEGNTGVKLYDIRLGSDFLDMTPKSKEIKIKIDNWTT